MNGDEEKTISSIYVNGQQVAGEFIMHPGTNADLSGKMPEVRTMLTPSADDTSETVNVSNGASNETFESTMVTTVDDAQEYITFVNFNAN